MTASLLYPSQCILGEGPIWHAERKSCFWVDIEGQQFYEYKWVEKTVQSWKLDYKVTLIIQDKNDHLLLGLKGGLAKFNLGTDELTWLLDIEKDLEHNRCNDGKCDSQGRLWIGTMHMNSKEGAGSLYCVDTGLTVHKKIEDVTISNGLVWSHDNKRLYYIDSPKRTVQEYLFDERSGQITFKKHAIQIPDGMGDPDGMTIDEEGMLWVAHWGGFGVYRWNPLNGALLDSIQVPVPNVSSCAFVGENLDHLLITSARQGLTGEALEKYPQSGDVFIVKPGVKGVAAYKCNF